MEEKKCQELPMPLPCPLSQSCGCVAAGGRPWVLVFDMCLFAFYACSYAAIPVSSVSLVYFSLVLQLFLPPDSLCPFSGPLVPSGLH